MFLQNRKVAGQMTRNGKLDWNYRVQLRLKSKPETVNPRYSEDGSRLRCCGSIDREGEATERPPAVAYDGRVVEDSVRYWNTRNWIGAEMTGKRNRWVDVGSAHALAEMKVFCLLCTRYLNTRERVAGVWVGPSCCLAAPSNKRGKSGRYCGAYSLQERLLRCNASDGSIGSYLVQRSKCR